MQAVAKWDDQHRPLAFQVGLGSPDHHPDVFGVPADILKA